VLGAGSGGLGEQQAGREREQDPAERPLQSAGLTNGSITTADQAYGHTDKQRRRKESQ